MRIQLIAVMVLCLTLVHPVSSQQHGDQHGLGHSSCSSPNADNSMPSVPMINSSFNIILATCKITGQYSEDKEIELTYKHTSTADLEMYKLIQFQSDYFDNWVTSDYPRPKFILSGEEEITYDIVFSPNGEVDWVEEYHGIIYGQTSARVLSFDGQPTRDQITGGVILTHEFGTLACDGPICYSSRVVDLITDTEVYSEAKKIEIFVNMNENDTDFVNIGVSCCVQYNQINTTKRDSPFVFAKGDLMIGKENSLQRKLIIEGFDDTNFSSWKSLENGTSIQIENLIIEARIDSLNDQIESPKVNIEIEAYYAPDPNETKKDDSSMPGFSNSLAILGILCGVMFYRRNGPESRNSK